MAKKKPATLKLDWSKIEAAIHLVRGQRVMLDADLARLYGVTTRGIAFHTSDEEAKSLLARSLSRWRVGRVRKSHPIFTK